MKNRRICDSLAAWAAVALMIAAAQVGCEPAVPENPTWTEDVRPILMANCARCHSDPPIGGAPSNVRLDRFENWANPNANFPLSGAGAQAVRIADRVANAENPMPPSIGPLNGRQQELLQLWSDNGAPRGEPLPDNAAPTVDITPPVVDTDANTVTFDYDIGDAEGDWVVGQVVSVSPADGMPVFVAPAMYRGTGQIVWDFTGMPGGIYALTASVDDGNTLVSVDAGSVDLPDPPDPPPMPDIPAGFDAHQFDAHQDNRPHE